MLYPRDLPASFRTERLGIDRRQTATKSEWNGKRQIIHSFSQWTLEATFPPMPLYKAETVAGWIDSMRGQEGTFRYYPRQSQRSKLTGQTLSQPGYTYNNTVEVQGWGSGAQSTLRVGQFFQLGTLLLRITTANAFADSAGKVLIEFEPELRITYPAGTALNFVNPCGIFERATSETMAYTLNPDWVAEFGSFMAVESLES